MAVDTKTNKLIINTMTKAQYEALTDPSENEIYLVPDDTDAKLALKQNIFSAGNGLTMTGTATGEVLSANVEDNVTSTSTTNALSAKQGKELADRITNLESRGRYLSTWNCSTGLPETDPTISPYEYRPGDYFYVSVIDNDSLYPVYDSTVTYNKYDKCKHENLFYRCKEDGVTGDWDDTKWDLHPLTNYKPDGPTYTIGIRSTVTEPLAVAVGDTYLYDGTTWKLLQNSQKTVAFANIAGQPTDNTNLATALNAKQNVLTAGQSITIDTTDNTIYVNDVVTAIPTPSLFYNGKIVQYVGTTTTDYIQGYFYKCTTEVTPASSAISVTTGAETDVVIDTGKMLALYPTGMENDLKWETGTTTHSGELCWVDYGVTPHTEMSTTELTATYGITYTDIGTVEAEGDILHYTVTPLVITGEWNQINVQPQTTLSTTPKVVHGTNTSGDQIDYKEGRDIEFDDGIIDSTYKKLEYVDTQGLAYANLGTFKPNQEDEYYCKFKLNSYPTSPYTIMTLFGINIAPHTHNGFSLRSTDNKFAFAAITATDYGVAEKIYLADTNIHEVTIKNKLYKDDSVEYQVSQYYMNGLFTADFCLMNYNGTKITDGRLYRFYIKSRINQEYIMNIIPVKRISDDVAGLYDTVSETFYASESTTAFLAGPELEPIINVTTGEYTAGLGIKISESDVISADLNILQDKIAAGTGISLKKGYVADGYKALEYVTTDGNAYLDTGLQYRTGLDDIYANLYLEIVNEGNDVVIGTGLPVVGENCVGIRYERIGGNGREYPFYHAMASSIVEGSSFSENTYQNIHITSARSIVVNNLIKYTSDDLTSWTSTNTIKLMGTGTGLMRGRIYSYRHTRMGSNQLLLYPAKRLVDSVAGLYDTVNDVFYTSSGTSEFTAGPEIDTTISADFNSVQAKLIAGTNITIDQTTNTISSAGTTYTAGDGIDITNDTITNTMYSNVPNIVYGTNSLSEQVTYKEGEGVEFEDCLLGNNLYRRLDYISTNKAAYINTGLRPSLKDEFGMKFQINSWSITSDWGSLFGSQISPATYNSLMLRSGMNSFIFEVGNISSYSGSSTSYPADSTIHTFTLKNGVMTDGEKTFTPSASLLEGTFTLDLCIFGIPNTGAGSIISDGKIYSFYIKDYTNDSYKINLIPAQRISDSVAGMYDTVSGNFFTSATSTAFVAGPQTFPTIKSKYEAGSGIDITDGVITNIRQAGGYHRGTFNTYADIPTTIAGYLPDPNGNTEPLDGDYIIVLNDETHNGNTYLYRYRTTAHTKYYAHRRTNIYLLDTTENFVTWIKDPIPLVNSKLYFISDTDLMLWMGNSSAKATDVATLMGISGFAEASATEAMSNTLYDTYYTPYIKKYNSVGCTWATQASVDTINNASTTARHSTAFFIPGDNAIHITNMSVGGVTSGNISYIEMTNPVSGSDDGYDITNVVRDSNLDYINYGEGTAVTTFTIDNWCFETNLVDYSKAFINIARDETSLIEKKVSTAGGIVNQHHIVAMGKDAVSMDNYTTTIGASAYTSGLHAVALGHSSHSTGNGSVALGTYTTASNCSVSLGARSAASGSNSIAIGGSGLSSEYTKAEGTGSIAIGYTANAKNDKCIAIGYKTKTSTTDTITNNNSIIAIGNQLTASKPGNIFIGNSIYNNTDLYGYVTCVGTSLSTRGDYHVVLGHSCIANGRNNIAIGMYAQSGSNGIASLSSVRVGNVAIGGYSKALGACAVAIGGADVNGYDNAAQAMSSYSIAIGHTAKVNGVYSIAIGKDSIVNSGCNAGIAIGQTAKVNGYTGVAIGYNTQASGASVAIGTGTVATSNAVGIIGDARGWGSVAIGFNSECEANSGTSVAVGYNAHISNNANESIQLGYGWLADSDTFQVWDKPIMEHFSGHIFDERLYHYIQTDCMMIHSEKLPIDGLIYQWTGTTNSLYTQGYFYKLVRITTGGCFLGANTAYINYVNLTKFNTYILPTINSVSNSLGFEYNGTDNWTMYYNNIKGYTSNVSLGNDLTQYGIYIKPEALENAGFDLYYRNISAPCYIVSSNAPDNFITGFNPETFYNILESKKTEWQDNAPYGKYKFEYEPQDDSWSIYDEWGNHNETCWGDEINTYGITYTPSQDNVTLWIGYYEKIGIKYERIDVQPSSTYHAGTGIIIDEATRTISAEAIPPTYVAEDEEIIF